MISLVVGGAFRLILAPLNQVLAFISDRRTDRPTRGMSELIKTPAGT